MRLMASSTLRVTSQATALMSSITSTTRKMAQAITQNASRMHKPTGPTLIQCFRPRRAMCGGPQWER